MNTLHRHCFHFVKILGVSILIFSLSNCASYSPVPDTAPSQDESAPAAVINNEGGIVGTGNEDECKDKKDKNRCNENVK